MSEDFEFRTDDLERQQIVQRNKEATARILEKAGITPDNPNYQRYYNATISNVHAAGRFTLYDGEVENYLIETIKSDDVTIEQYEAATKQFRAQMAEKQVTDATGSVFKNNVDMSYGNMRDIMKETTKSGVEMRKTNNPYIPADFYDENGVMRRLVVNIPDNIQQQSAAGIINVTQSKYENVSFNSAENIFEVSGKNGKSQKIGPEKFFKNRAEMLDDKFLARLGDSAEALDMNDTELFDIIKKGDYEAFQELRKSRGMSGNKTNQLLRNALGDEIVFKEISGKLAQTDNLTKESFMATVKGTADEFSGQAAIISKEAEKSVLDTGGIDRVRFSTLPSDLAQQSTFQDWKSCMHAVGCNHRYVDDSIGAGSIIAYGYNSKNPQKMVSRLLIHPYTNDKGEVAYKVNNTIYGKENLGFRQTVDAVVAEKWNKGKNGVFTVASGLYDDNHTGESIALVSVDHGKAINLTDYAIDNKVSLEKCDLSGHPLIVSSDIKKLDLSKCTGVDLQYADLSGLNELKLSKDTNMPKVLDLTGCYYVDLKDANLSNVENLKLPYGIKSLEGIELPASLKTLDLSNSYDLNLKGADLSSVEDLKLPKNITSLEDCKLPPSLKTLDLSGSYDIDLKNADLSAVEDLKLPERIKSLEECKLPGRVDATGCYDFSNVNLSSSGVKEITIGNQVQNLDFTSVDKVNFEKEIIELEADNVKFSGKLDFSDKLVTLSNCDLSKVDELVLPETICKNQEEFASILTEKYGNLENLSEKHAEQIMANEKIAVIMPDCKLDGIKKIDASKCKNFDLTQFNYKNLEDLKLPAGYDISKLPAEALENPAVAKAVSEVKTSAKAAEQTAAKTTANAEVPTGEKSTSATLENKAETSAKRMEERMAERNAAAETHSAENTKTTGETAAKNGTTDAVEKEVKSAATDSSERMAERMAAKGGTTVARTAANSAVKTSGGVLEKVAAADAKVNNAIDKTIEKADKAVNDTKVGKAYQKASDAVANSAPVKQVKKAAKTVAKPVANTAKKVAKKVTETAAAKAAKKAVVKTAAKTGAKAVGKSLLKKIPVVSAVAGVGFGIGRLKDGDWKGALGEVASGVCGCVPGLGTAASTAIDVDWRQEMSQTLLMRKNRNRRNRVNSKQKSR